MKLDVSFAKFFNDLQLVASTATESPYSVGVLVEPSSCALWDWIDSKAEEYVAVADEADVGLCRPVIQTMRDMAIREHDKTMALIAQGALCHSDVCFDTSLEPERVHVAYYDFLEPVNAVMGGTVTLGRSLGRVTVAIYSEKGASHAREIQQKVSLFIRGFLSKAGMATPTAI